MDRNKKTGTGPTEFNPFSNFVPVSPSQSVWVSGDERSGKKTWLYPEIEMYQKISILGIKY